MLARVLRLFSPARLAATGLVLLVAVAAALWLTPSRSYLYLPDPARAVDPLITVPGEKQSQKDLGGIYFVDVIVRRATLIERLFPSLHDGSTLVPASLVKPPGTSDRQRRQEALREMSRSQSIASAVALRALGYKIVARPRGALIAQIAVDAPAAGKLQPTDIVVAVDGRPVRTPDDLRRLIRRHRPGESVRLTVRDAHGQRQVTLRTIAAPGAPSVPIIGVIVDQAADLKLPLDIRVNARGVGGPSAGLAFALDVLEELGRDVDRGYKVAATGELRLDGTVRPIGGVKQKTIGARRAGVDVFLVPAGENAREARRYAKGLRIIAVQSFPQALHALATLRPKA